MVVMVRGTINSGAATATINVDDDNVDVDFDGAASDDCGSG